MMTTATAPITTTATTTGRFDVNVALMIHEPTPCQLNTVSMIKQINNA
jgi:hypothetical protein